MNPNRLESAEKIFLEALASQEAGDLAGAERLYAKALELAPDRPSVMNNLATIYIERDRHAEARLLCERLLKINPDDEIALVNLGSCQIRTGPAEEALASYEKALKIRPDYELAHVGRGRALQELNRLDEALASYDRALAIRPGHADTLNSRGNVLMAMRCAEKALASYELALTGTPDHIDALCNRGIALLEMGRPDEALASVEHALTLRPDHLNALNTRGIVLLNLGRREEFIESHRSFLALAPDHEYARGYLLNARLHCCDWAGYDESVEHIRDDVRSGKRADTPFNFLAVSHVPADQLTCSRTFIADKYPAAPNPVWRGERYRHDRVRLAYLSGDFHNHAVAQLMVELFETHDRARFETTAVSIGPGHEDALRKRLEKGFDRFLDVQAKGDRDIALLLRELEIDIAVDLQGFTKGCRAGILAQRAAPLQVNYFGYPGTMGADYVDYIIADKRVIPEAARPYYSEKVVYLPDCYQVNSRRAIAERIPTRAELALPEEGFVFCCFNNNYKILPPVFDRWMRLLSRVNGSVLWLLEDNAVVARNLRREAERRGVAPGRLIFASRVSMEDHLARHRQADLFLDTLPYNAHVTASDALWAGLPVLTCESDSFAARVAGSLLNAIGLPEMVTATPDDYERLALKLATDSKLLADVKTRLAQNRSTHPLFNTDRFRRHIESAYLLMWERARHGEPPVSFSVPAIS